MKTVCILAAGLAVTLPAFAKEVEIASFNPAQLHLSGSYCTFERKPHETVLASDWVGKYWMKVDGKMIELVSDKAGDEADRQLATKRWHEALGGPDFKVELSFVETTRGEDSVTYKGYLDISRYGFRKRIPVNGGCGA